MTKKDTVSRLFKQMKREDVYAPSELFRKNARIRIINSFARSDGLDSAATLRRIRFMPVFRMAMICLIVAVNILYAAQFSNPTDPLFPVKVLSERIALSLSPNEQTKMKVVNTIIERRAKEAEEAKLSGDTEEIHSTIRTFQSTVTELHSSTTLPTDEIEKKLLDSSESDKKESEDVKGDSTIQPRILPVSPTPTEIKTDSEDHKNNETESSSIPEVRITAREEQESSHD